MIRLRRFRRRAVTVVDNIDVTTNRFVVYNRAAGGEVAVSASGSGTVYIFQSPAAYASVSWHITHANQSRALDNIPSTYAEASVPAGIVNASALTIDYSTVEARVIFYTMYIGATSASASIAVSNDGSSYTTVATAPGGTHVESAVQSTYRYLRVLYSNPTSSPVTFQLYEVQSFNVSSAIIESVSPSSPVNRVHTPSTYYVAVLPTPRVIMSISEVATALAEELVIEEVV